MAFRPIKPGAADIAYVSPRARTRPTASLSPSAPTATTCAPRSIDEKPVKKRAHHKVDRTGPNWDADGNYVVGKWRPPQETRWKKGQSGNPRGPVTREKLSAEQQLERAFLAPFDATVNGETVSLTMDVLAIQSLKSSAVKGSVRAAQIILEHVKYFARKAAEQETGEQIESWELETIDRLLEDLGLPKRPVVRQTDRSVPRP